MKPTIRITSLPTWQECKYKYHLSSEGLRLRPHEGSGLSPQVSGTAIHFGIEAGLLVTPGQDRRAAAIEAANTYLDRFGADRYRTGVYTAISGVPQEIWDTVNPQSEQRIFLEYDNFILTGKLDLWTYSEDAIIITDYKSTSKDEQDRLEKLQLFNMQLRYYAVLLRAWLLSQAHAVPPIYTRHLVLSTRGKHAFGVPQLMSTVMSEITQKMILSIGNEIATYNFTDFEDATVSSSCAWCDYQNLCIGHLTGADTDGIIKMWYRKENDNGIF